MMKHEQQGEEAKVLNHILQSTQQSTHDKALQRFLKKCPPHYCQYRYFKTKTGFELLAIKLVST